MLRAYPLSAIRTILYLVLLYPGVPHFELHNGILIGNRDMADEPTCPPTLDCLPNFVLPTRLEAIAVFSPISTLCAICMRLSSLMFMDYRTSKSRPINAAIASYLHVILYHHVTDLRYLFIAAIFLWRITKSISSDNRRRMYDHVAPDLCIVVDLNTAIDDGVICDLHVIPYKSLGIYLHFVSDLSKPLDMQTPQYSRLLTVAEGSIKLGLAHPGLMHHALSHLKYFGEGTVMTFATWMIVA